MDKVLYDMYKGDIEALLKEDCFIVYHIEKSQYLEKMSPPQLTIPGLEDLTDAQKHFFMSSVIQDELPLFPEWTDDVDKCFKITSLISLAHIMNNLLWQNQFDLCRFLLSSLDGQILNFDPVITRKADIEFINELINEHLEW